MTSSLFRVVTFFLEGWVFFPAEERVSPVNQPGKGDRINSVLQQIPWLWSSSVGQNKLCINLLTLQQPKPSSIEDWIHWNENYFEAKLLPVGSLRLSEDVWNQVQNLAWPERKKHNKVHQFVVISEQLLMLHSKGAVQQQLSFKKTESLQDLT